MSDIFFGVIDMLLASLWTLSQIVLIVLFLKIVKKKNISPQKVAQLGFAFLLVTVVLSMVQLDTLAGKTAEYVWILFTISFIQQFIYFLKTRNNSKTE